MKIGKFLNMRDGGEIDDDDVFQAELKLAFAKLDLLVLEEGNLSDVELNGERNFEKPNGFMRHLDDVYAVVDKLEKKEDSEEDELEERNTLKKLNKMDGIRPKGKNNRKVTPKSESEELSSSEEKEKDIRNKKSKNRKSSSDRVSKNKNENLKADMDELKKLLLNMQAAKNTETKTKASPVSSVVKSETTEVKKLRREQLELEKEIKNEKKKQEMSQTTYELNENIRRLKEERKKLEEQTSFKTMSKSELKSLEEFNTKLKLNKYRIDRLFKDLKKAEQVDICFMLDCTGSMGAHIKESINAINKINEQLGKQFQDFQMRSAFVGYRDIDDGADRVTVLKFSENKAAFKSFVATVSATGGADQCEDIFGGLEEIMKLDWKNMTRVLFHIGDAPCHGRRFHVGANDNHPSGDPRGLSITDLMKKLAQLNITYYFAEINSSTVKMIEEFDKELQTQNGNPIITCKLSSAADITKVVTASVTRSIMESKSLSMSDTIGKPKKFLEINKTIDWELSGLKKHKADFFEISFSGELENLKDAKIEYRKKRVEVYLAPQPFAKGTLRYATAAMINKGDEKNPNYVKFVLKESIYNDAKYSTMEHLKESIESHLFAIFLAKEFQKVSKSQKSIKYIDISIVHLDDTGVNFSAEEYFNGEFHKWSNNADYIDVIDYSATLDCFSHWTYQATNQYLVVTDLQGRESRSQYTLTDPAITCPDEFDRFTNTNLGLKGLKKFFQKHQCNHICKAMGLKMHEIQKRKQSDR